MIIYLNKITKLEVESNAAYLIMSRHEGIEGAIVENSNLNIERTIIINSFSNSFETVLLPKYFLKHKKLLSRNNLNYDLGVFNSKCIKLLFENEKDNYDVFFVSSVGLSYEGVDDLKKYLIEFSSNYNKTSFFVLPQTPDGKDIEIISTLRSLQLRSESSEQQE